VPAPELESAVIDAIRRHLQGDGSDPMPIPEANRELIEQYLLRATLNAKEIALHLRADRAPAAGQDDPVFAASYTSPVTIAIPWTVPAAFTVKGIVHVPAHNTPMKPGRRELLLTAIAKARRWLKAVERGHSFTDIARREAKAERHVRHLAPLAFVSPRMITAIMDGTTPGRAHCDGTGQQAAVFMGGARTAIRVVTPIVPHRLEPSPGPVGTLRLAAGTPRHAGFLLARGRSPSPKPPLQLRIT
jgi:hypothetical protein